LWTGENWIVTNVPATISATQPSNPTEGQQWVDTSTSPDTLKVYHKYPTAGWVELSTTVKQGTDIGVDNGATRNVNRGLYSATADYVIGDIVSNTVGDNWWCQLATKGNAPPTTSATLSNTYWVLFVAGGAGKVKGVSFCRHTAAPDAPLQADGSFTTPNATGSVKVATIAITPAQSWSDGVPSGTGQLYMTTRLFSSNDPVPALTTWSTPVAISRDGTSKDTRYTFSSLATAPTLPANNTQTATGWGPTSDSTTVWMSQQTNTVDSAGAVIYGTWISAIKIKGEKGDKGDNAFIVDLISETDTTVADSDGKNYTMPPANTLILYSGGAAVTSNVTYSVSAASNGLIAAISATGVITFTATPVTGWAGDVAIFTFTARYNNTTDYSASYSYSKSRKGSDAVIVNLKAGNQIVSALTDGSGYVLPSNNAVVLYKGGAIVPVGAAITYAVTPSTPTNGLTVGVTALTGVITISGANWSSDSETFTIVTTYASNTYTNTYTIAKSKVGAKGDTGANALVVDLLSETDTTVSAADGTGYSLPPSNNLKLYSGGTALTSNVTYSVSAAVETLTAAISPTGIISFTGTTGWTSDVADFTFTARYDSIDYSASYRYTKSKKGTDATIVNLKAGNEIVQTLSDGTGFTLPTGNAVVVYKGGVVVPANASTITYAVTPSTPLNGLTVSVVAATGAITLSGTWTGNSDTFSIATTYAGTTYNNFYSITKAKAGVKGADSIFAKLDSGADVITADSDGKNYTAFPANNLKLYIGGAVQTANVAYSVSAASGGLTATIQPNTGIITFGTTTSWTADVASFTFTARYNSIDYVEVYSCAKSKKGSSAVLVDLNYETSVVSTDALGTTFTLPTNNAVVVYEGGVIVPANNVAFPITYAVSAASGGLTLAVTAGTGAIVLSGTWTGTTESFTITTTYKSTNYTNRFTIAKSIKGSNGGDGKSYYTATVWCTGQPNSAPTAATGTYNFSSKALVVPTGGGVTWVNSQPTSSTTATYATVYTFVSDPLNPTSAIAAGTWSTPVLVAKNGVDATGSPGTTYYTAKLWRKSLSTLGAADAPTSATTYNFSTKAFAGLGSWLSTQPASEAGMPTWSTTYTYSTTAPNSNVVVSGGTWSTPITEAQLGANGTSIRGDTGNSAVRYFIIVDIGTTPTAATSSTTATPAPNSGVFNWTTSSAGTVAVGKAQWQVDGIYTVSTGTYAWGQPYLSVFKVDTLSAFTVNTGNLNMTGNLNFNTNNVAIKSGGTSLGGQGFYLGLDGAGAGVFSVKFD
jgi:hypothetical protein